MTFYTKKFKIFKNNVNIVIFHNGFSIDVVVYRRYYCHDIKSILSNKKILFSSVDMIHFRKLVECRRKKNLGCQLIFYIVGIIDNNYSNKLKEVFRI